MKRRNFIRQFSATVLTLAALPARFVYGALNAFDITKLVEEFGIPLLTSGDPGFSALTKVFNLYRTPPNPDAILASDQIQHYQTLIAYANGVTATRVAEDPQAEVSHLKIRPKCGGHSYEYFSMGEGIVCDVNKLRVNDGNALTTKVVFNEDTNTAHLSAGLKLREAIGGLAAYGKAIPVGSCPTVGLAGFILGGGLGLYGRTWGLGCDRVKSMKVITATQGLVTASEEENKDLFWAMLGGGGGNFGLVTEFEFAVENTVDEIFYVMHFDEEHFPRVFAIFQEELCVDVDQLSAILQLSTTANGQLRIQLAGSYNGYNGPANSKACENFLINNTRGRFSTLTQLATSKIFRKRPSDQFREDDPAIRFKAKSHYSVNGLNESGVELISRTLKKHSSSSRPNPAMIIGALGGAYDSQAKSNAYPHRQCRFSVEYYRNWGSDQLTAHYTDQLNRIFNDLDGVMDPKAYVNYPDFALPDWAARYYGDNLPELLRVKKIWDPNHIFDFGQQSLSSLLR